MSNCSYSCPYGRCWLPENNSKYWWQVFFLVISIFILLKNTTDFSFTTIFLFVFPIMVDIITTELKSKVCNVIRWFFGLANGILLICCILGFTGVIIDKGDCFALVSTFMIFKDMFVPKGTMAIALAVDTLVPFIFLIGTPSQKKLRTLEVVQTEREGAKNK